MEARTITYCEDCFAELREPGPCFSCGWSKQEGGRPGALAAFTSLQDGRYILGRVLGAGGFGMTYAALDTRSGAGVAIKEYMPSTLAGRSGSEVIALPGREGDVAEGLSRFGKEWRTLSSLANIKSIVRGLGFFSENRTAYIVMERLTGADVKALLRETAPQEVLPFCELVVSNIGAALVEVHNRGIVHLDVSPANIFFQSDGSLRLIDFGSAVCANDPSQDTVQLKHGFAPPEMYSAGAPKGPWTDVYALAATYYNLVTGIKVPPAETRLLRDELVPLENLKLGVPKHISDSVKRALSLNLNARYKTVLEFLSDFTGQPPPTDEPRLFHEEKKPQKSAKAAARFKPAPQSRAREAPNLKSPPKAEDKAVEVINRLGRLMASVTPKAQSPAPNQPAPAHIPVITAQSGRFAALKLALNPGTLYRLGRVSGPGLSDFAVSDDPRISKVHLHIRYDWAQGKFLVTDVSTNGTFFPDGRRLGRGVEYAVYPGGVICLASPDCSIRMSMEP